MYEIPVSIVLAFLLMLIVSLFFNAYTFYKWHKLIEEHEELIQEHEHFKDFVKTETGWETLS
tara:strand:+ start:11809 stop:11994 length:186 start_codon:yes stop_codon:yes gene_type:complete